MIVVTEECFFSSFRTLTQGRGTYYLPDSHDPLSHFLSRGQWKKRQNYSNMNLLLQKNDKNILELLLHQKKTKLSSRKELMTRSLPRSTFSKGLPLPKTMFGPACLKASIAVHSAGRNGIEKA